MTSSVILGSSWMALQLSSIWLTLVAPRMTVLTLGFLMHQASASCVALPPSRSAIAVSLRTFSIFALPSSVCSDLMVLSKVLAFVANRESSGIPSLYLPVSRPEASGDQIVVPYWNCSYSGAYSTSKR